MRRVRQSSRSACCVRVGIPVDGCCALDVEQHRGDLGEIRGPMNSASAKCRVRGRRERARAVPRGADHDADRRELVLGLDDRVFAAGRARRGTPAVLRKASASDDDGVIDATRTVAPPYTPQRRRCVTVDENALAHRICAAHGSAAGTQNSRVRSRASASALRFDSRSASPFACSAKSFGFCRVDVEDAASAPGRWPEQLSLPRIGYSALHMAVSGIPTRVTSSRNSLAGIGASSRRTAHHRCRSPRRPCPRLRVHRDHQVDATSTPASPPR